MAEVIYKKKLELSFREKRDYIYGPDLFINTVNSVCEFLNIEEIQKVDFSSHHMARVGLDLILFGSEVDEPDNFQSKMSFITSDQKYTAYLIENSEEALNRLPYPEDVVFENSITDYENKAIKLMVKTPFLLTDNYTALTKQMHYQIYPEIKDKWIFVRVMYNNYQLTNDYNELEVKHLKNFQNKYTQNALLLNNERVGTLFFSLI